MFLSSPRDHRRRRYLLIVACLCIKRLSGRRSSSPLAPIPSECFTCISLLFCFQTSFREVEVSRWPLILFYKGIQLISSFLTFAGRRSHGFKTSRWCLHTQMAPTSSPSPPRELQGTCPSRSEPPLASVWTPLQCTSFMTPSPPACEP